MSPLVTSSAIAVSIAVLETVNASVLVPVADTFRATGEGAAVPPAFPEGMKTDTSIAAMAAVESASPNSPAETSIVNVSLAYVANGV